MKKDLEEAINDFLEDMKGELWDIKYQSIFINLW